MGISGPLIVDTNYKLTIHIKVIVNYVINIGLCQVNCFILFVEFIDKYCIYNSINAVRILNNSSYYQAASNWLAS